MFQGNRMDDGNIPGRVPVFSISMPASSLRLCSHWMLSWKSNTRCRTSWYQSAAVILSFFFTMALWYCKSDFSGSAEWFKAVFDVSLSNTRGSGTSLMGLISSPGGKGATSSSLLISPSVHGCRAPSILNNNLWITFHVWLIYESYPRGCCSSPSPRM